MVSVDATIANFDDGKIRFVAVPGMDAREAALEVEGRQGWTLLVNDIVANIRDAQGFGGWISKIMGFAGDEPQIPVPEMLSMIKDRGALARQLRYWATTQGLTSILVRTEKRSPKTRPAF